MFFHYCHESQLVPSRVALVGKVTGPWEGSPGALLAASSGDLPKERCLQPSQLLVRRWVERSTKAAMVSTPKHWQLSSSRGPGAGLARAAPRTREAPVSTGAQKPGPTSAHSVKKRLEIHLEKTAALAHPRCASSTEATAGGTVVSLNSP